MDNKYFKAIDSLMPRDESVEKTIEAITEAEQSGKVIEMKPTKRYKKFTAIGTIAASLAFVLALGAFFYPGAVNTSKTNPADSVGVGQNGFFIKAYAAEATGDEAKAEEITSDEFVKIGKFVPTISFATYGGDDDKIDKIGGLFNYDLRCEGDNIDKLTYKIDNSVFCIKNGYKPVISRDGRSNKNTWLTIGDDGEYNYYYSYTVDYNNQPDLSKYTDDALAPIQIMGTADNGMKADGDVNWSDCYSSIFKDTVITVTATFKDGSTRSQKLQLKCNYNNIHDITVEARIIK